MIIEDAMRMAEDMIQDDGLRWRDLTKEDKVSLGMLYALAVLGKQVYDEHKAAEDN